MLIPESEFRRLQASAMPGGAYPEAALPRLETLACGTEVDLEQLRDDPRAAAILLPEKSAETTFFLDPGGLPVRFEEWIRSSDQ